MFWPGSTRCRTLALALRRRHDLETPVDLRRLSSELEVEVVPFPFRGRITEAILGRTIGVRPRMARPDFRWCVSHAIGHHLLHVGGAWRLQKWHTSANAKSERQAEEFAAWLLGGSDGWFASAAELGVPAAKLGLVHKLTRPEAPGRRLDVNP